MHTDRCQDLFTRIAPVEHASLRYDRAGRSEGIAFVTYERLADARTAIREFDGANAKGQPIRLTLLPIGSAANRQAPRSRDNPFDRVENPRSLFDRIEAPTSRARRRSDSPLSGDDERGSRRRPVRNGPSSRDRRSDVSGPPPDNVDRYVPRQRDERSPRLPPGRRPGERRERGGRAGDGGVRTANGRPRKTAEELDAEMEDYWGSANSAGGEQGTGAPAPEKSVNPAAVERDEDIDMIE